MIYRVWYKPYGFQDEEDFVEVTVDSEKSAREKGAAYGWVVDVEVIK